MKIVINACYGGFGLSEIALYEYCRRKGLRDADGITACGYRGSRIPRDDPILVAIIDEMGEAANGDCSRLRIEKIDDNCEGFWEINEYDGAEHVVIRSDALSMTRRAAGILYDPGLTDEEKLRRLYAVFPPLPIALKKTKVDALYDAGGPVEKRLSASWGRNT